MKMGTKDTFTVIELAFQKDQITIGKKGGTKVMSCPDCGYPVSTKAKECPCCGYPLSKLGSSLYE